MIRKLFLMMAGLFFALTISAKEDPDSAIINIAREYYRLYNTDNAEEFYKYSELLCKYHFDRGEFAYYYMMRQNEIFYDSEHGETYKAIKKANDLLEEMKESDEKRYDIVYLALGHIFEQQGNFRMALHYYQESLDNTAPTDSAGLANIYAQLAAANITRDPDKAWYWNERMGSMLTPTSLDYKPYLVHKARIQFFKGEKKEYFETRRELDEAVKGYKNASAYPFGDHVIKLMDAAFLGKYEEALQLLDEKTQDYDAIQCYDIRIRVYEMMGQYPKALEETDKRRDLLDSLSNDLLFSNINEINAAAGIARISEKASKERELWLTAVIILLIVALGLSASRYITHRRYQRRIVRQNEQLEIALDEAKESERMKNIFIRHISHEVRTPLNIITGYVQIVSNPEFELEKEERDTLLKAIEKNTVAITDIIDDLLEVSQEESKERYRRDDEIAVNAFCRRIMSEAETANKGRLKLCFKSELPDKLTITSNQSGLERILQQLLNNALKFTDEGQVELTIYKSADGNSMHFAVADTGIGIPEDRHEQIFEHFYKLDSFKQGLGIGLSMSRKIAILLGGTLNIDKEYHNGTRMILTIPAK